MTSTSLIEYAMNAVWQVPLIAGSALLFLRAARLGPVGEHRLWLAVLAVCVVLPTRGIEPAPAAAAIYPASYESPAVVSSEVAPEEVFVEPKRAEYSPADVGAVTRDDVREHSQPHHFPWPNFHLRVTRMHLAPRTLRPFTWIYATFVFIGMLRLVRGWLSARHLLNASRHYAMDETELALWHELTSSLRATLPATSVRSSSHIASPVVLGILKPALLLPDSFHLCAESERRAALCHELAHIKRRDCMVNALCQIAALPLVWHPLMHLVQTHISRTREMICDAIAAREMPSQFAYARSLLGLARHMLRANQTHYAGPGMGLFRTNKLEVRVMRLTEDKAAPRNLWIRRATGSATLGAALCAGSIFHLTPVLSAQADKDSMFVAPVAPLVAPAAPTPPETPSAPFPAPAISPAPRAPRQALAPASPSPVPEPEPQAAPAPVAPGARQAPVAPPAPVGAGMIVDGDGTSLSISHGRHGHVIIKDGDHVHRWVGADGKPFELINGQAGELTKQQQQDAEAEYQREIEKAHVEVEKMRRQMESPEWKAQMQKVTSGEVQAAMADAQKQLAEATAKMNTSDMHRHAHALEQYDKADRLLNRQMKAMNDKDFHFNLPDQKQLDASLAELSSPQFQARFADIERQAAVFDSPEFEKRMADVEKRMDEATKRLERASQELENARKQLEETHVK